MLNAEERTHQTGETALQGQSNTRETEREREGEVRGHKGYVRRKKERSASLNIEKGCYSLLLEAWPCCTATDVDPLNGLLCDKRQHRNRTQAVKHFITQKMCFFRSPVCTNQRLTGILILQE